MTDREDDRPIERFDDWKQRYASMDESAGDLFSDVSHIALCLSYDMIDKLRWWEKETLKQPEEEIEKRLEHMSKFLDQLKQTYLTFADVDF